MPEVTVEREIVGVSADRVWTIARNLLDYPKFMEQVISVEPCDIPGVAHATAWVVLFNGNELQWTEADEYFDAAHRMTFQQISGDLAEWHGSFETIENGNSVIARYQMTFDLGVPALSHILHPLGEKAIRDNCGQMLREIEARSRHEDARA